MPAKVRYSERPFGDRVALYNAEMAQVRKVTAAGVRVVFGLVALILAIGALLVVFGHNISPDNPLVKGIWNVCGWFDGPFSREGGVFAFHGNNAAKLNACVNWGCAAAIYLVFGSIIRSALRHR